MIVRHDYFVSTKRNNALPDVFFLENILCVTHEGNRIKIIDFGLARKYDPDKKLQVSYLLNYFIKIFCETIQNEAQN